MCTVAELRDQGFTHVSVECAGCRATVATPWAMMPAAIDELAFDEVRRRLRCRRCRQRPKVELVSPWAQWMASGYQRHFPGA